MYWGALQPLIYNIDATIVLTLDEDGDSTKNTLFLFKTRLVPIFRHHEGNSLSHKLDSDCSRVRVYRISSDANREVYIEVT